jgi:hypothetical protein
LHSGLANPLAAELTSVVRIALSDSSKTDDSVEMSHALGFANNIGYDIHNVCSLFWVELAATL